MAERTIRFGEHSAVPLIGQGTWFMGENPALRAQESAALRAGIDLGLTVIDTAEMYADGGAEEVVGEAIRGQRERVVLVSKVYPWNAGGRKIASACEESLRRLNTDYLDLYLLHWRGKGRLADTVAAFEELVAAGKIRSWGVSNFDAGDLWELLKVAGPGRIACNQVLYHLRERAIEHAVVPWCEAHGVAVTAYSPFGHDEFPEPRSAEGRLLQAIAGAHGATPRQVALAFLTRRPSLFAIPKAADAAHAADNAAAASLRLSEEEIAAIDQAFPLGPEPASLPML